jgi:hypothetical protein
MGAWSNVPPPYFSADPWPVDASLKDDVNVILLLCVSFRGEGHYCCDTGVEAVAQGADPLRLPLLVEKAGRDHLNKQITPLLPTGIGERIAKPHQI